MTGGGNNLKQEERDMKPTTTVHALALATVASFAAGAAVAQTSTFENRNAAGDAVENLQENIADDYERDVNAFGNAGRKLGFDGSVALRSTAQSGNSDSFDVGLGANLGWYDGTNGFEFNVVYDYGENNGVKDTESLLYGLEYTRDFGDRWYAYAQVQGSQDDFASYRRDTFAGFGVGYKVVENANTSWYVSAGPGYRWAELSNGMEIEEEAASIGSNFSTKITETVYLTNDTDFIFSESDNVIYNDFGVNVAVSRNLAMRTSIATEYHTDPLPGDKNTDNTLEYAANLNALTDTGSTGTEDLIDEVLANGTKQGYNFVLTVPGTPDNQFIWTCLADATVQGTTGDRHFGGNMAGLIFFNASAAVTFATDGSSTDPVLGN
jgi:putative salt-induced outer membrane protein